VDWPQDSSIFVALDRVRHNCPILGYTSWTGEMKQWSNRVERSLPAVNTPPHDVFSCLLATKTMRWKICFLWTIERFVNLFLILFYVCHYPCRRTSSRRESVTLIISHVIHYIVMSQLQSGIVQVWQPQHWKGTHREYLTIFISVYQTVMYHVIPLIMPM